MVAGDAPLLPVLHGPGGLAHVIDGVAKIRQDALVDSAGANGVLELQQLRASLLQLKIDAPEALAGDQQLHCSTENRAFFRASGHHSSETAFAARRIAS